MSYSRSRRKRRRVRYDRIIGVAAVFIVLIIIFVSCCKSCGGSKKDKESSVIPTVSNEEKNNADGLDADGTDDGAIDAENPLNDISSYTTVSAMPNEVFSGDLILVNKEHEYSFPATEAEADIVPIYEKASESYKYKDYVVSLSSKTISALNSMMDAFYAKTGKNDIMVIDGYRTKEEQNDIDSDVMGGFSEYHTGMSFDIGIFPEDDNSYYYIPEGQYEWIDENCEKYGFILRYPKDKEDMTGFEAKTYQFRYVGVPHAVYMKENDMCLEEYIDEVKNYLYDDEHLKISTESKKYEVYYVPADPSANTDIPVPEGKSYEISGNNIDGFIITAEI